MGKKHHSGGRLDEERRFAGARTIDVTDERAMRFWADRLGVTREELAQVVKEVGPNTTAVALKFEAPQEERVAPPTSPHP